MVLERIKSGLKTFYVCKKYGVKTGANVYLNLQNTFEGRNSIDDGCRIYSSDIGLGTYICSNTIVSQARIGRFCSIGNNVKISMGRHPTKEFVSTHPAFFSILGQADFTFTDKQLYDEHVFIDDEKKFTVEIGNDVWIGDNVLVMDGVTINDGAVIGAGSIVTKDIPAYSINTGSPAKQIGRRFNNEQTDKLLKFRWWEKDFKWIRENSHRFGDIESFLKEIR